MALWTSPTGQQLGLTPDEWVDWLGQSAASVIARQAPGSMYAGQAGLPLDFKLYPTYRPFLDTGEVAELDRAWAVQEGIMGGGWGGSVMPYATVAPILDAFLRASGPQEGVVGIFRGIGQQPDQRTYLFTPGQPAQLLGTVAGNGAVPDDVAAASSPGLGLVALAAAFLIGWR